MWYVTVEEANVSHSWCAYALQCDSGAHQTWLVRDTALLLIRKRVGQLEQELAALQGALERVPCTSKTVVRVALDVNVVAPGALHTGEPWIDAAGADRS